MKRNPSFLTLSPPRQTQPQPSRTPLNPSVTYSLSVHCIGYLSLIVGPDRTIFTAISNDERLFWLRSDCHALHISVAAYRHAPVGIELVVYLWRVVAGGGVEWGGTHGCCEADRGRVAMPGALWMDGSPSA